MPSVKLGIVSPTVLVVLACVIVFFKDIMRGIILETRVVAFLLLCIGIVLAVPVFTSFSFDPFRQTLDLATILALLVSILISAFVWLPRNRMVTLFIILAVAFGVFHNLPTWFDYNNAIRPPDKETIAYINTLDYQTYNTSSEVAFWIYDLYLTSTKHTFASDAQGVSSPILIVRNIPMTPRSDPRGKWYDNFRVRPVEQINLDSDYNLLKAFSDGKVTVKVYEKNVWAK